MTTMRTAEDARRDPKYCRVCYGIGTRVPAPLKIPCPSCKGTGIAATAEVLKVAQP
jgi:DnaJ-class molecular chaperone